MNNDQDVVSETKEVEGFKGSLSAPLMIDVSDKEVDSIRKDWFKHVLLNIEKLYCIVEETRKENIISLQMLRDDIKDLTSKINNKIYNKGENKNLVKENTDPAIKAAMCGALAGFVGGIVSGIIVYIIEAVLF